MGSQEDACDLCRSRARWGRAAGRWEGSRVGCRESELTAGRAEPVGSLGMMAAGRPHVGQETPWRWRVRQDVGLAAFPVRSELRAEACVCARGRVQSGRGGRQAGGPRGAGEGRLSQEPRAEVLGGPGTEPRKEWATSQGEMDAQRTRVPEMIPENSGAPFVHYFTQILHSDSKKRLVI